ncbi:hypothetical protein HMPREF0973_00198 [Prevotella veroralis F0319]|uniref:Uncharacterized protein n=1 Tax=Prevotella veroralis F0319 TaxID=649761 RepID=C9MKS4_9BACT|nr:hypothetical protein HMPREF0973_00198 [Prevotella veroralis F0319]
MQTLRFKVIFTFDPYKYCFLNKRVFLRFEGGVSSFPREAFFDARKGSLHHKETPPLM